MAAGCRPRADWRWAGRAGLSAIEFKGWIYVLGGGNGDDVIDGSVSSLITS